MAGLVKRSFSLAGHRTSVALEPEFWDVLTDLAQASGQSLVALVIEIDAARGVDDGNAGSLASGLRIHALRHRR